MANTMTSQFEKHPLFAILRDHLDVPFRSRDLNWEHRLGELTAEICPPRSRGLAGIPGAVAVLKGDVNLQNRLWNARAIFFAYGAKELRQLQAAAKSAGFELGISHLASAQALAKRERMQVLFRCIREKWTVVDLRREVLRRLGGRKRSGGGAPPSLPKSTEAALDEIIRHTNTWLNRFERTWFSDIEATFGQRLDRAEVNQLRDKFREADEVLSRLSTAAANGQRMLHRQLRR